MPGAKAGLGDRLEHQLERFAIGAQARREAAFVADAGREPALLQDAAQRVEDLDADAQAFAEAGGANRHHHELLEVDVRVGVRAAVEDVHHRHRQQIARGVAGQVRDVRVEARAQPDGVGLERRHRDAEQRVGAEPALVGGAVEANHRLVELALRQIAIAQRAGNLAVDVRDGFASRPCRDSARVAVAQLQRFALAGRRARGHRRAPARAALEHDVDFNRGIAARVENLARLDVENLHAGNLETRFAGTKPTSKHIRR